MKILSVFAIIIFGLAGFSMIKENPEGGLFCLALAGGGLWAIWPSKNRLRLRPGHVLDEEK